MAVNKSYKEQLMELYGAGQNNAGAAQSGAAAQTGTAAQGGQSGNAMLDLIMNRKPFQYDAKTDPAAQAARKEAGYNAKLATEGTLGSYAGMTGGIPSTAAVSAAAQAGSAAMQRGADKVAELKNLAYQNYQDEGQDMYNLTALMQQQEADAYAREQAQKQWDYNVQQDEYQKQLALAQLKASYGDLSGLKALGVDTSKYTGGGGSSSGGYYSSGGGGGSGSGGSGGGGGGNDSGGGGLPTGAKNELTMAAYDNGGYVPAAVWNQYAAQYGEQALIDAGFKKGQSNAGRGNTGGVGDKDRPGKVDDRVNTML